LFLRSWTDFSISKCVIFICLSRGPDTLSFFALDC
jgi:hypothetical protein